MSARHDGAVADADGGLDRGGRMTVIGETRATADRKADGNAKYRPVTAHIKTNAAVQKPTALWRSHITRFHWRRKSTVRLRVQPARPGHQITRPVAHIKESRPAPTPLTTRPV